MQIFPQRFFWGTATSAHQVEGNNTRNDWWDAEQKGLVPHASGQACDSYNRYEEDFDFAKAMANNAHRFSIEWSRIEPEEGMFDGGEIEHYRKVLQALRARGLEPFVTLHHFTNPLWFAKIGGWANKKAPEYFERYVEYVASHLGAEATYWITVNEPMVVMSHGYIRGSWPPFHRKDIISYFLALKNMARAHRRAYKVLHAHSPSALVGIAQASSCFEPADRGFWRIVNSVALRFPAYLKNYWFLQEIRNSQDFIGINYYNHYKFSVQKGFFQDGKERSDFGWEIYPKGMYDVVKDIYRRYKKPMFITENGIADARDAKRPAFIRDHIRWLHKAIEEGMDVRGYFHWSLLDNFEWAEGFTKRFGLVEVNFETLKRTRRPSGKLYGEISKANGM